MRRILLLTTAISMCSSPVLAAEIGSTCYGSTTKGRLENGAVLPPKGPNFESYTTLGGTLGRTWVHSRVRDVVVGSYKALETSRPGTVYVYGETGKQYGGPFKPHKTHQNGLSVDFMVPIIDSAGRSVPLPSGVFNEFGYGIEFDSEGRYRKYSIDFEAMADHILALKEEADREGIGIWRVIFDPQLQTYLFATKTGPLLKENNISFSKKRSWVRHDEHYHVDFIVACEEMDSKVK
jgi:penicillin-insensitive murein endopeptidase